VGKKREGKSGRENGRERESVCLLSLSLSRCEGEREPRGRGGDGIETRGRKKEGERERERARVKGMSSQRAKTVRKKRGKTRFVPWRHRARAGTHTHTGRETSQKRKERVCKVRKRREGTMTLLRQVVTPKRVSPLSFSLSALSLSAHRSSDLPSLSLSSLPSPLFIG
jgi:hypothetical protein